MSIGAVILAAGFGTRLAPLTDHTPKPLLEVGGRPVVSHLVGLIQAVDADAPIVVVANDQHPEPWRRWQHQQGPTVVVCSNGVTAVDDRLGAVADLARGVQALPSVDQVLVLAGDNLILESLQPHLDAARADGDPIVLCRDLGDDVPPGRFGEITVDDVDRVVRFREKPADPSSPLAATCTYVLPGSTARTDLAEYLTTGDADSPGSFVAWLAARRTVRARTLTGDYFDIGNHETLADARARFAD